MDYSLFYFPFWFDFNNQVGWGVWFIIPVSFTILLGNVIYKKGCWFFRSNSSFD